MSYHSPQQSVFNIAELVEQILLFAGLSPLNLLRARLTNKTCNLVILSARPFREVLFLDHTIHPATRKTTAVQLNPLLEKMFPMYMQKHFSRLRARRDRECMLALGYFDHASPDDLMNLSYVDEALLPQVAENIRCRGREFNWACFGGTYEGDCLHLPLVGRGGEEHLQRCGEELWRNMYATRPAIPFHVIEVGANGWQHKWEIEAGATMGQVMDSLVSGVRPRKRVGVSGKMEERSGRTAMVAA